MPFPSTSRHHAETPQLPSVMLSDDYDNGSTDSDDTARLLVPSTYRPPPSPSPRSTFLFLPNSPGQNSTASTANSTPNISRSSSPLPQFFTLNHQSSCSSETESEPSTPLFSRRATSGTWRQQDRRWWEFSQRRRRRDGRVFRLMKKWMRRIVRHPLVPKQPITIVRPPCPHLHFC